ncbi:MAG TPA: serine protease [Demequinaceae bacterium]
MRKLLVATVALLLAGCSSLPSLPPPLPTDFVPSPSPTASDYGPLLSPDGFDVAQRMTVRVRNIGCGFLATGTGFMIDEHTLVTNRHVIEDSSQLEVSTYDGHAVDATAARSTTAADIAIIRVNETLPVAAHLAEKDPQTGDAITVIGYPGGGRLTTTSGIVLGSVQDPLNGSVGTVLGTTAKVEPGSSGSPVLNAAGEVVGVIYAKNDVEQSFMIPVSVLRQLLDQESLLIPQQNSC